MSRRPTLQQRIRPSQWPAPKRTDTYRAYTMDTFQSERRESWAVASGRCQKGTPLCRHLQKAMTPSRSKTSLWRLFQYQEHGGDGALGRGVGMGVNIKPQHFNSTSIGCLITAAREVDPLLYLPYQIRLFTKVSSLTYSPNSCVDLDFGNWSDHGEEDQQTAMVIDYDTGSY
jgi:hypothetical protein